MKALLAGLYLAPRAFVSMIALVVLFVAAYFYPQILFIPKSGLFVFILLAVLDLFLLFRVRNGLRAERITPERFSNGDDNAVQIRVRNHYPFMLEVEIIDELPVQLQKRDFRLHLRLQPGEEQLKQYMIKPLERGDYAFGALNLFASTALRLAMRRYQIPQTQIVPVYPAFLQMRKYELYAVSNRLTEAGIKKTRRVGHSMEFEHIRKYVRGDDYRTLNWKATARKSEFMVNHYEDEKSQQVYSCIDMGRVMEMPFGGMSLLDYAINASLVISNIALHKQDKAGVITFAHKIAALLPAEGRYTQLERIMRLLYSQATDFQESNFEALSGALTQKITHRSLVLLFTNFETINAMQRRLPYLRKIARRHLVVAVFFENDEIKQVLRKPATTTEELYIKALAEKFVLEKKQIVKELQRYGIQVLLTAPQQLTVSTINKYLEIKARGMI